ncbi:hypothetical protein CACET_c21890 [Clostridium aceticum]|uniref:Spo0E like sporulation regulatory protein n=2 Tax=Clostridium aceticum TaxID=84022 RepID=A0A0G3WCP3_9CLOT|nr:hypothetical protein CACET_c21890 [Clostridium aceticum]
MIREEVKDFQEILKGFQVIEEPEAIEKTLKLSKELDEFIFLYEKVKNI